MSIISVSVSGLRSASDLVLVAVGQDDIVSEPLDFGVGVLDPAA